MFTFYLLCQEMRSTFQQSKMPQTLTLQPSAIGYKLTWFTIVWFWYQAWRLWPSGRLFTKRSTWSQLFKRKSVSQRSTFSLRISSWLTYGTMKWFHLVFFVGSVSGSPTDHMVALNYSWTTNTTAWHKVAFVFASLYHWFLLAGNMELTLGWKYHLTTTMFCSISYTWFSLVFRSYIGLY